MNSPGRRVGSVPTTHIGAQALRAAIYFRGLNPAARPSRTCPSRIKGHRPRPGWLVSITQELGDDPAQVMMRQVIALFDEYQSKENAKHVLRAMKENARQGFWNGSCPPLGYTTVEAERRGARVKKKLAIDPVEAEQVQLIFKLFLEGQPAQARWGSRPSRVGSTSGVTRPAPVDAGEMGEFMPFCPTRSMQDAGVST